jgi:thiamine biosynthesis lipoprotein
MRLFRFDFEAMASPCAFHLYAEQEAAAELAAIAAQEEVARIETKFSRYRPQSEISRLNRAAKDGGAVEVDDETAALLDFAFAAYEKSGGLFDITSGLLRQAWDFAVPRLPKQAVLDALLERVGMEHLRWQAPRLGFARAGMELDFGGIGKEYAVDRAAEMAAGCGIAHGMIDLGGDMRALGPHPDGTPWRVGIRNPRAVGQVMTTVLLGQGGLASSGDYERFIEVGGRRYCHILDPRTGWPCEGLASVSVLAEGCLAAGCVATIAMLKGKEAPAYLGRTGLTHLYCDGSGGWGGNAETV